METVFILKPGLAPRFNTNQLYNLGHFTKTSQKGKEREDEGRTPENSVS